MLHLFYVPAIFIIGFAFGMKEERRIKAAFAKAVAEAKTVEASIKRKL